MGRIVSVGVQQPRTTTFVGATRPDNASAGLMFFNTSHSTLEIYDGTGWHRINDYRPIPVTTSTTVTSNKTYWVDTTGGAVVLTLPSSPSQYDYIKVTDVAGTFESNNLTVNPNGQRIMRTADNMTVSTNGASLTMIYYNATTGWLLEAI